MPAKGTLNSLDHLVGTGVQRHRNLESERFGRPEIDHQFEGRRLHDRKVRRLGACENAAGVDTRLAIRSLKVGSVADKAACGCILTKWVDGGNS